MGHYVSGGNQVNVVTAVLLKGKHHIGQIIVADIAAVSTVIDLPILAEAAQKVAVRKENSSRSAASYERTFFAEVRIKGCDLEARGGTEAGITSETIYAAIARAEMTVPEDIPEFAFQYSQTSFAFRSDVGRLELRARCFHIRQHLL